MSERNMWTCCLNYVDEGHESWCPHHSPEARLIYNALGCVTAITDAERRKALETAVRTRFDDDDDYDGYAHDCARAVVRYELALRAALKALDTHPAAPGRADD